MAGACERGAAGSLRQTDLRSLLRCANASAQLSTEAALEEAFRSVQDIEQQLELPHWLKESCIGDTRVRKFLNAWQITGLLLHMSTRSQQIAARFYCFAAGGRMSSSEWLAFVRAEQFAPPR